MKNALSSLNLSQRKLPDPKTLINPFKSIQTHNRKMVMMNSLKVLVKNSLTKIWSQLMK